MNSTFHKTLAKLICLLVILSLIPSGLGLAQSGSHPAPAVPFEEAAIVELAPETTFSLAMTMALLSGDVFQNGADRLAGLQNNDGGWDWPLNDGNPANISAKNTVGPIAQGLAKAYLHTADPDHLAALQKAGTLLLAKVYDFSPSDGYLAATLDDIFGGTTYTDHVTNYFYGPLAAGTYNRNGAGTNYNTAQYVNLIRTGRAGSQANLAAWDIGMGLAGAAAVGADTTAWVNGLKTEIDELNTSAYYDVIGLAGAIYGLAFVGEDYDPQTGPHAVADSLADLGMILAGYQLASGGFTWNSYALDEGADNESVQETAYAILALNTLDRVTHLARIEAAGSYLESVQLGTGGWEGYTGSGENNEITGEALWAIHAAYPYTFTGFSEPIDMSMINSAKAGQTIAVKWRLTDADGLPVSDASSFVNLRTEPGSCDVGVPSDAIETYSGGSGLQYLGDGYWQYNWKTPKSYAGRCRSMYVEFNEGFLSPIVTFRFK